jgi:hypothetical protein
VVEDDEPLLCDQHTADNAPAKTSAITLLPLQKTLFTANLHAPDFTVSRNGHDCCDFEAIREKSVPPYAMSGIAFRFGIRESRYAE